MANYIELTQLPASHFVSPDSRYLQSTVYYYTDRKLLTFGTYKRGVYRPSRKDQYWIIEKGYEYRPDLVSNKKYGSSDFWWRIMEVNGMKDILEFKTGTNIMIPNSV